MGAVQCCGVESWSPERTADLVARRGSILGNPLRFARPLKLPAASGSSAGETAAPASPGVDPGPGRPAALAGRRSQIAGDSPALVTEWRTPIRLYQIQMPREGKEAKPRRSRSPSFAVEQGPPLLGFQASALRLRRPPGTPQARPQNPTATQKFYMSEAHFPEEKTSFNMIDHGS